MAPFVPTDSAVRDALRRSKKNGKGNITVAAGLLNVKRFTLNHRVRGRKTIAQREGSSYILQDFEEAVICEYVIRMDRIGIRCRSNAIRSCANDILAARYKNDNNDLSDPLNIPTVGASWPHRFLHRHPEIHVEPEHPIEFSRAQAEDPDNIKAWFDKFKAEMDEFNICWEDCWNFDEAGFIVGQGRMKKVLVETTTFEKARKRRKLNVPSQTSRAHITVVEAISATGGTIPSFIILQGKQKMAK